MVPHCCGDSSEFVEQVSLSHTRRTEWRKKGVNAAEVCSVECVCSNPQADLSLRLQGGSPVHSGTSKYGSVRKKHVSVAFPRESQTFLSLGMFQHKNFYRILKTWNVFLSQEPFQKLRNFKDISTAGTFSGTQKCLQNLRNFKHVFSPGTFPVTKIRGMFLQQHESFFQKLWVAGPFQELLSGPFSYFFQALTFPITGTLIGL